MDKLDEKKNLSIAWVTESSPPPAKIDDLKITQYQKTTESQVLTGQALKGKVLIEG